MSVLINDPTIANEFLCRRRLSGADRYDEVWDGVYIMSPIANNEHQSLATELSAAICMLIDWRGLGRTLTGANVSDQPEGNWTDNYRIPDIVVFLNNSAAIDRGTHWFGGPDFAIEIVSPNDGTLDKLDFYSKLGTRELLIIDRHPWQLTLYRRVNNRLAPVAISSPQQLNTIASEVIPLLLQLESNPLRIRLTHRDDSPIRDIPIQLKTQ